MLLVIRRTSVCVSCYSFLSFLFNHLRRQNNDENVISICTSAGYLRSHDKKKFTLRWYLELCGYDNTENIGFLILVVRIVIEDGTKRRLGGRTSRPLDKGTNRFEVAHTGKLRSLRVPNNPRNTTERESKVSKLSPTERRQHHVPLCTTGECSSCVKDGRKGV